MSRVDRAAFWPGAACSFRKGDDRMRIRELAERTGTTPETIRYYERIGLLPKAVRETNNYRRYGAEHVSRLDFIRHCRNLDIGLEEIRALLDALDKSSPEAAGEAHRLIHRHLEEVDARIADLMELKHHLTELASSCAGEHREGEPCGILESLHGGDRCCGAPHSAKIGARRRA